MEAALSLDLLDDNLDDGLYHALTIGDAGESGDMYDSGDNSPENIAWMIGDAGDNGDAGDPCDFLDADDVWRENSSIGSPMSSIFATSLEPRSKVELEHDDSTSVDSSMRSVVSSCGT